MESVHRPVMLEAALAALKVRVGGWYVDGTAGGGGHTRALLKGVGQGGLVLALDRDPEAVGRLEASFGPGVPNLILRQGNFSQLGDLLAELGWGQVDGVLLDLGLSTDQLERSGRGFSFLKDEPLDMRMEPGAGPSASELVNGLSEGELADLIFRLGEERASRRIARAIVWAREKEPLRTSAQLAAVIRKALARTGRRGRIDPATRTFMALRLAVNRELEHLERFLARAPELIRLGGRLVVISFHSLEDRLVKRALVPARRGANRKDEPGPVLQALFKKPKRPAPEEVAANPRARSARLRAGECVWSG